MKFFAIFCAVVAVASAQTITTQQQFFDAINSNCQYLGDAMTANSNARESTNPVAQQYYQPILDSLMFTCSVGHTISMKLMSGTALENVDAFKAIPHQMVAYVKESFVWVDGNGVSTVDLQQRISPLLNLLDTFDMQIESIRVGLMDGTIDAPMGLLSALNTDIMNTVPTFIKEATSLLNDAVVKFYATLQ